MAMDSSERNASGEAPKVELETIRGVEIGSEKDLAKSDGIASAEPELNDHDEIGGPYVIINGDSDNPSEKILKLDEKADPETTGGGTVSPVPSINHSNGIGGKEVEGVVELESRPDPVEEEPLSENLSAVGSQLGEELAGKSKEGTENDELLCENKENDLEVRGVAEKELVEETVSEEISRDKGEDQESGGAGGNEHSSEEVVVGGITDERGEECELSLAGELDTKNSTSLGLHHSEISNGEEDGSKLAVESGEKDAEEHPVSGAIEGTDDEMGKMDVSETIIGEPGLHEEFAITSIVEEKVPQEAEQEATIEPSVQIISEQSGTLSESHDALKVAEVPASVSEGTTLNLAVEEESEQKHEIQHESVPCQEEMMHEESQGASDSLQSSMEVEMPASESKEQYVLDSTVGVDSEPNNEVQQVGSNPSQEDDQHEVSEGVPDSVQSNKESDTPGTEVKNQSPLDSAVNVDSEKKLEDQHEAFILSPEVEICDATKEVPVPSDGKKQVRDASEPEFNVAGSTITETKTEVRDTLSSFCNGTVNGELETSPHILIEKEKDAPSSTYLDHKKLAQEDTKHMSIPREANGESETVISDTTADKEAPSEPVMEIVEMKDSERGVAQAVSASSETEVASRSVNENELLDSSRVVLAGSEIKSTIEVEERDRSMTEFEGGQSKTEVETVSVASSDASFGDIGPEDSVQIGKFKISIVENGPPILQQDLQESSVTTEAVATDEPGTSSSNGEKPEVQQLKRQPIYIMKVPRYSDEVQWEKIQEAQARLDDLTRARDAIRDIMQKRRKECADLWDEVIKAREEERAARVVFNAKRHEISTVQSVINKLNKANSIDDMDDLIEMKEKSLQHETMTLKQEKMLIQEIKELKAQRKKLIDNMGSAAEIDEAFDQKDGVFDKMKILRTESEVLQKTLAKAEEKTKAAKRDYDDMDFLFCSLQNQYKSADEVRQKGYLYWRNLKTELVSKNKLFFNYRDDAKRAASFSGQNPPDKEGLRLFCSRQVDNLMDVWNSDAEFRKQYVNSNRNSTLRRLKTLDGRSLGPDEVPPVIPTTSTAYRRTSTPLIPATKEVGLEKSTWASSSTSIQGDEFPELPHQKAKISHGNSRNNKDTSSKDKSMNQTVVKGIPAIESAQMEKKQEEDEMERRKKEEEERARREEDIKRKAKAEAEEKERLRKEQKAKAKEAEERKRRKAEKAQERAEFKARKEAETRDKKKAKKDKKKATGGESDNADVTNSPPAESSVTSEIAEPKDVPPAAPTTATRRPTRPQAVLKQLKRVEPVPVALRNRNRRKMQSWIIGIATAMAALLTVFLIGNYVNFSDISSLVWL